MIGHCKFHLKMYHINKCEKSFVKKLLFKFHHLNVLVSGIPNYLFHVSTDRLVMNYRITECINQWVNI